MKDEYLTIPEIAEQIDIPKHSLYYEAKMGRLKYAHKRSGVKYYHIHDINTFLTHYTYFTHPIPLQIKPIDR